MSLATIFTRAQLGVDAPPVTVEVHLSNGLPGFTIVGLPETAVKESKDRVRSAILNSHLDFPARRITVNLAPADLPKEGGRFDLPIALGILAASEQIPAERLARREFIGELALSGELRSIRGSIPAALACSREQHSLTLPKQNNDEASLCTGCDVQLAGSLLEVCAMLHGRIELPPPETTNTGSTLTKHPDLAEVKGQYLARRALEIAATGGHNLLMYGPPGTGKSMLASRLSSILPPLNGSEALDVAAIRSVASGPVSQDWLERPFRSPHHTTSAVAMVGGGTHPRPGEISLAHHGILFLDELPEFPRSVLEVLREPLECGHICISRANARVEYPAHFQLVAAMNPCPCGYYGDRKGRCGCSPAQVKRYRDKISGPLLDRIDLHVQVENLSVDEMHRKKEGESSDTVRARVADARQKQLQRQKCSNAALKGKLLNQYCTLGDEERDMLSSAMQRLNLSARAYDRILRVSRTIADLGGSANISCTHLGEALSFRQLDKPVL